MPIIPTIITNNYDGKESKDIFSLLLEQRIIMINDEITDQLAALVVAEILFLNAKDQTEPITIYINSPGGSIYAGLAIYDIMKKVDEMDFNYGTRIHGAIGNILCGVPSLLFPTDARIRELAEYHNIPAIPASAVTPDTDLAALYDQTDFRQVNNGHAERFWHLIDFLNENGIKTIYDDRTGTPARSLYDEKTAATSYAQPVHSMLVRPPEEIARRVDTAVRLQRKEIEDDSRLATQLRDSQRKVIQLQERNKKQAAQIQALKEERKALKTELKATKKPLRRLARYQRTSTFGIGLARLKKKLRRLLGKEK